MDTARGCSFEQEGVVCVNDGGTLSVVHDTGVQCERGLVAVCSFRVVSTAGDGKPELDVECLKVIFDLSLP